jgi:hypothetical protein
MYYSGAGPTVDVVWGAAGGVCATTFNLLTQTWGAPSALLALNEFFLTQLYVSRLSTGELRIYMLRRPGATEQTYWAELVAGLWSAVTQVSTNLPGSNARSPRFVLGSLDDLHMFWQKQVAGAWTIFYRRLSAAGVLSAVEQPAIVSALAGTIVTSQPVIWQGQVVLPFIRKPGVFTDTPAVLIGNPEPIVAAWSVQDIDPPTIEGTDIFLVVSGANLHALWLEFDFIGGAVDRIRSSLNIGAGWGVPSTFYDAIADPVVPLPPFGQFLHNLSFTVPAAGGFAGTLAGIFGLEIGDGLGGQFCTVFFQGLAIVTTLAINKVQVPPADPGLWNLQIDGVTVGTGANVGDGGTTGPIAVAAGLHQAGETPMPGTNPADYITTFGGDLAADGSIVMALGDVKVGIITNTRIPTITVTKILAPPGDLGLFNLQIDGVTVGTGANVGNGGTTGAIPVAIGAHQTGETAGVGTVLANYVTVFGGDVNPAGIVVIAAGENLTATITNTRIPLVVPVTNQGGFRRMVVLIPNLFDLCLQRDGEAYRKYAPQHECCQPILWRDINWVRAPQDYIPFRKVTAIPTPLAAAGDVEVLNFQVPPGYDGVIAGLFNVYTGPGFREGNGDIEWRLIVNRTYAVHLGQIMVTLGSQDTCYPVDGGIFIQSGTRIRYIVNVPNLSGGILPLASQIVCGLEGLFYART